MNEDHSIEDVVDTGGKYLIVRKRQVNRGASPKNPTRATRRCSHAV
jgi:hypothetical protein